MKKKSPSGELFAAYINLKSSLAAVGIIARETRKESFNLETAVTTEIQQNEDQAVENFMNLVESSEVEYDDTLIIAWEGTPKEREELLLSNISTADYIDRLQCLKDYSGYELVKFLLTLWGKMQNILSS